MSFRSPSGFIRPGYDPVKVSDAPTAVTPAPLNQSASIDCTPPSDPGWSPITEYYALVNPGGITASSVTPPVAVTGLTNGVEYTAKVWANNSYGPSPYSAESSGFIPAIPDFIEDVFSAYLHTGNGSTQTITNGIDLAGEGGMVWIKCRSTAYSPVLFDTLRGGNNTLRSNTTDGNRTDGGTIGFTSSGWQSVVSNGGFNAVNDTYVSWTFRKAPKFFDVVTYTGTGTTMTVPHNLGSVPGCMIVKGLNAASAWDVYHRSLGPTQVMRLNTTAATSGQPQWDNTAPTSTVFTVKGGETANVSGRTYVAYLFAHDAGGFGDDGLQNVISCGSFTTDGSGNATVDLGWEPQWVLTKPVTGASNMDWRVMDNMRGITVDAGSAVLVPNSSNSEFTSGTFDYYPNGFKSEGLVNNTQVIYIAIRRGPMKAPESGASVFEPLLYTGTGLTPQNINGSFAPDLVSVKSRSTGYPNLFTDRLRGSGNDLNTSSTASEPGASANYVQLNTVQDGFRVAIGNDTNQSGQTFVGWSFRRAPGFFDEVCYTGTGVARTVVHNLGVAPGLMIVKSRSDARDWRVYYGDNTKSLVLQTTAAAATNSGYWNNTSPTASVFTVGTDVDTNYSSFTYVAYLFATLAGVSKVGSYTGTAALQTINCGFSAGARFVLIKRVDAASSAWYVWDSARGIVAGNDPYLLWNSTAAEVTSTDYIDTDSTGFQITATAPAAINASGGTFIFLAIA